MTKYKYFSDEEQSNYDNACLSMAECIDHFVDYVQKGMSQKAFTLKPEDFEVLRVQHNYLTNIATLIKSEANKLQETK